MPYSYDRLNQLQESLDATGVLSKDYASRIMQFALGVAQEAHAAGKAEAESRVPTMKVGELDELDWAFIHAAVTGPNDGEFGVRAMFGEDVDVVATRVAKRVQRVVAEMALPSPLALRLYLLEPFYTARPGSRYGALPGMCWSQGGVFRTACGLPRNHRSEHSWESRLCLWRCENGHVLEQVMGEPSECKLTIPKGVGRMPCDAKSFIPLSACARRSWMDARDPASAGRTTEIEAVGHAGKGAKD